MSLCDPYRSPKKMHVENKRLLLRHAMSKSTSFNILRQEQEDRMRSHVSSYPKPSLGGKAPHDAFVNALRLFFPTPIL